MQDFMASEIFRCIRRTGETFDVFINIGPPSKVPAEGELSEYAQCAISMEPFLPLRMFGGENEFQALCMALDYIRFILKSFFADGGRIYWRDTDSPVNLNSSWFAPMYAIGSTES
ncbi:hypothetical protein ACMV5I_29210 [Serratia sp. T13T92]|jgi:hypothetical protein|uniref:hypothetical protein n=1 Tax=Serratia sp. T13T92 TaxID=3397496 RepID=UPI0039DFF7A6